MKLFKKTLITTLIILLLTSCGSKTNSNNSPSTALDVYLKTSINEAKDQINEELGSEEIGFLSNDQTKDLASLLMDFSYEITNEQINEDNATCDLTIKTYDFGKMFQSFFQEYFSKALATAISGEEANEEKLTEMAIEIWTTSISNLKTEGKTYTQTIPVSLTKVDNTWTITDESVEDSIAQALSGGLYDAINNIASSLSEFE